MIVSGFIIKCIKTVNALKLFLVITLLGAGGLLFVLEPLLIMALILVAVLGYSGSLNLLFIIFDERVPAEISVAMFEVSMAIA